MLCYALGRPTRRTRKTKERKKGKKEQGKRIKERIDEIGSEENNLGADDGSISIKINKNANARSPKLQPEKEPHTSRL